MAPYVRQCSELLSTIRLIEAKYYEGRTTKEGPGKREDLFKEADNLQSKLHAIADLTTKIILTRHGETKSDEEKSNK